MCIVLVTRTKNYTILLSNRDEFLARPTTRASFWPPPHTHILSGRDSARPAHGTWLGITRHGRFAVLTNFREDTEVGANSAALSRGEITNEFLTSEKGVEEWISEVLKTGVYKSVGGFSLLCGVLKKGVREGFAVVSNRSSLEGGADYVLREKGVVGYECEGLSNSLFHDEWPKVKLGRELLRQATEHEVDDEDEFIERCFGILSYFLQSCADLERIRSRRRQSWRICDNQFLFRGLLHRRVHHFPWTPFQEQSGAAQTSIVGMARASKQLS
jgi:uncharacterized protein with NRDE domain